MLAQTDQQPADQLLPHRYGRHHLRQDIPFEARPLHPGVVELFGWFMTEAGKRGMTISLSDYTLGVGQGSYVDEMLAEDPTLNGSNRISTVWNFGRGSVSRGPMRSGRFRRTLALA